MAAQKPRIFVIMFGAAAAAAPQSSIELWWPLISLDTG
jgi:hypothetical protein